MPCDGDMTFGETLRHIRAGKKLSQREVARRIPMDYSRFSRLENDRLGFKPTRETVEKIAQALKAGPEERGALLAAAGRLDQEAEALAQAASKHPAIGRLLSIAASLSSEEVEQLLNYAEANFVASRNTATNEEGSSAKQRGNVTQPRPRE